MKLVRDQREKIFALKVFDLSDDRISKNVIEHLKRQVEVISKLNHKYIAKYYGFQESSTWIKKNGKKIPVAYIKEEFVEGIELCYNVEFKGGMSEPLCRYFFKQILMALYYMHFHGITHNDLKPENILITKDYDIKIVDFGFGSPFSSDEGTAFKRTYASNPAYTAPEVIN